MEENRKSEDHVDDGWHLLAERSVPSVPGNERLTMQYVVETVGTLNLPAKRLAELQTAVAEATMNAMEHGNHYQPDKSVTIQILATKTAIAVRIIDNGGDQMIPEPETPDLEAKLASLQSPRGWGLFLIKNLVDDMRVTSDKFHHTIELIVHLSD